MPQAKELSSTPRLACREIDQQEKLLKELVYLA
jgi:hypothetical protein